MCSMWTDKYTRNSSKRLYLGQEAAASVIGSSLYEEIPAQTVEVLETVHEIDDDFFGESGSLSVKDILTKRVEKQLLVFLIAGKKQRILQVILISPITTFLEGDCS